MGKCHPDLSQLQVPMDVRGADDVPARTDLSEVLYTFVVLPCKHGERFPPCHDVGTPM